MESAIVFDIQKFSVHDGPGIRTTVFLKGCPLRCQWCHNPESWRVQPEMLFSTDKCVGCGRCVVVCPNRCHEVSEDRHDFERKHCVACGKCAEVCFQDALELCGRRMTPEAVLVEVLKDKLFYDNSHGGMTVSGGEPMMHFPFTRELLNMAKEHGIHTAMETCGFAEWELYEAALPLTDLFLWDVKAVNPDKHRRFTGQDNTRILSNLRKLDERGACYRLRCPMVPGLNDADEDLAGIAELANSLRHPLGIDVEPYHPLGVSKAQRLGMTGGFAADFTPAELADQWVATIARQTDVPVRKQ